VCVCETGDGDIAARIPGVFSVRVSNGGRGSASYYSWTRTVTVMLGDVGVRIDLLRRRRVRVNRRVVKAFLPRDAMRKCGICRHAVSVCLSVTFVSCVKTMSSNFFHHQAATPF